MQNPLLSSEKTKNSAPGFDTARSVCLEMNMSHWMKPSPCKTAVKVKQDVDVNASQTAI